VIEDHQKRIYLIKNIFSRIAGQYDQFNRCASLGQDRFWRQAAAKRVKLFHKQRVIFYEGLSDWYSVNSN